MKKQKAITLIALIITIVILMILALVTINVTSSTGILTKAKAAASSYKKADIKEKAELVKVDLTIDSQTDKNVIVSKQEYMKRLEQEFSGRKEGNKVVVEGDTYDIIIKNTNLDIEVREHSDIIELDELVQLSYDEPLTNLTNNEGNLYAITVKLNIKAVISSEEYQAMKESQEIKEEIEPEQKKAAVLTYLSEEVGQTITDVDQFTVLYLNNANLGVSHDTIEAWLGEEKLLEGLGVETITKEQLNAQIYGGGEVESLTNDQVIDRAYNDMTHTDYAGEYNKNTSNLSLYLGETLLSQGIGAYNSTYTYTYKAITKNGTYEFLLKNSEGNVVAFETITINNIEDENPYVISEDKNDKWETNGSGTITKYLGTEKDVTVPVSIGSEIITHIGTKAFSNCKTIKTITIPNTVGSILTQAFEYCSSLEEISLPNTITSISNRMFIGCTSLKEITIPESIIVISEAAFANCSSLEKVKINGQIDRIGNMAFDGCSSLNDIVIPNSVTYIGYQAFTDCSSLKEVIIPCSISGSNTFGGCTSLEKVTFLEDKVITIGNGSFNRCTSLKEIAIPNSVTNIDTAAFYECINLTNIYFAAGDNPIPSGQPWGATNENLVITKLTQ